MAKASIIAARHAQAAENMADALAEVLTRLERIERKIDMASASLMMVELGRLAWETAEPPTETVVETVATETEPAPAVEIEPAPAVETGPEAGAEAGPATEVPAEVAPATESKPAKQPASKEVKAR